MKRIAIGLFVSVFAALASASAHAEAAKIRVGKQMGFIYLPLLVAQKEKLIEKHAAALGLPPVEVEWVYLASASALTDAILSGNVEYVAGASTVLNVLWDKTKGNVKGIANLGNFDFTLNVNRPEIKTVADFTDQDRIAVSGVKLSIHAIVLQMAAEKAFGEGQWNRLDKLTVSLPHPEGLNTLLSNPPSIAAHLTTPPFQNLELADPRVHKVFATSDILGSGAPILVFTSKSVRDANPRLTKATADAIVEAIDLIHRDPHRAAQIYTELEKTPLSVGDAEKIITSPVVQYSAVPRNILSLLRFQYRIGTLKRDTNDWRDMFFPEAPQGDGS